VSAAARAARSNRQAAGVTKLPDPRAIACELALILSAREYLWPWLPAHLQGMASKGLGAALVLVLLSVVYRLASALPADSAGYRALLWVLAFGAWHALQTMLCSGAYMIQPWPVREGVGICAERIDFDLGALGLLAVAYLAVRLSPVNSDSISAQR